MDGSTALGAEDHSPGADGRWIAINTHPHREQVAVENLARQNFEVYCPRELKRVRHARSVRDVLRPLFPGYLFARVSLELSGWRPIQSTYGVRTLIRFGDQVACLENGFIEQLRAREIDGVIARPATPYRVGQEVRLNGGPFDGLVATIIEMDAKDRLVLLATLLNQSIRLQVRSAAVRDIRT
jgi:transcriptional antiterminator RfaH